MRVDRSNGAVFGARAAFAAFSGLVVAVSSVKWAVTHGKGSDTFAGAIKNANAGRLVEGILLGLVVALGNGCQYFNGIQDNTTNITGRVKEYYLNNSAPKLVAETFFTTAFTLMSGAALGGLYQSEFEKDNQGLRLFIFAYMTAIGMTFTREVNYDFVQSIGGFVQAPVENIKAITAPKPKDALRLTTELGAFLTYYFVFGRSVEDVVNPLFGQKSDNSFSSMAAWGMTTLFLSAAFAKLTSKAWERVANQVQSMRQDFASDNKRLAIKKLLYILLANPLTFLSTASFFISAKDDANQGKYDALGVVGRNMEYFAGFFAGLANISSMAQVFNYLLFGVTDKPVSTSSLVAPSSASGLASSTSGSGVDYGATGARTDGYARIEDGQQGAGLFDSAIDPSQVDRSQVAGTGINAAPGLGQ